MDNDSRDRNKEILQKLGNMMDTLSKTGETFDPEENFIFWLFDQWLAAIPSETIPTTVSSLKSFPGALYQLQPGDEEALHVLDAVDFSRNNKEWWTNLSNEDQGWVASMRSRLYSVLESMESK